jgi:hypothetical protein
MGAVMFHVMEADVVGVNDAGGIQIGGKPGDFDAVLRTGGQASPVARARRHTSEFTPKVCPRIAGDSHVPESRGVDAGKAIAGGLRGKAGPVFDAIEALLFGGSDQFAVGEQRRRRVTMEGVQAKNVHRGNLADWGPASSRANNASKTIRSCA